MWNEYELNFSIESFSVEDNFQTGDQYVRINWSVTAYNVFGHETTVYPSTEFAFSGYPRMDVNDGSRNVDAITDETQITNEILVGWVQNEWEASYTDHPFVDDILNGLGAQYNAMNSFTFEYDAAVTLPSTTEIEHLILDHAVPSGIGDIHANVYFDVSGQLIVQDLYNPEIQLTVTNPSSIGALTVISRDPDGSVRESTHRLASLDPGNLGDMPVTYIGTLSGDQINTNGDASWGNVYAGAGNDTINVDGNYWVTGAEGNDVITDSDEGNRLYGDYLSASGGDDVIMGNGGDDLLNGGAGDDELDGGSGNDTIYGGSGDDQILGSEGTNDLYGGYGNDNYWLFSDRAEVHNIYDVGGIDELKVLDTEGRDSYRFYLLGDRLVFETAQGAVANMFNNEDGTVSLEEVSWWNDTYRNTLLIETDVAEITVANFIYAGTPENDILYFPQNLDEGRSDWSGWGEIYLDGGDDYAELPNTYFYFTYGGTGNDTINASSASWIEGQEGNDLLIGSDNNDNLSGGDGGDTIRSGAGDDTIFGGAGRDWITPGLGANSIDGGSLDDDDILFYEGTSYQTGSGVFVNNTASSQTMADGTVMSAQTAQTSQNNVISDDFANIRNFHTTEVGDEYHTDRDGYAFLRGGDDKAVVHGANVTIFAGSGDDTIIGVDGANVRVNYWADGYDDGGDVTQGISVAMTGQGAGTIIDSWGHTDIVEGVTEIDGSQYDDFMQGAAGNDGLSGEEGRDSIYGGGGVDTIWGGDGNDDLRGGAGNDIVYGGAGNDQIAIDTGRDTVSGGEGRDWFHIWNDSAYAVITDYTDDDIIGFADNGNHFAFSANFENEIITEYDETSNITKIIANTAKLTNFEIGQVTGHFNIDEIWNNDPGNGEATFIRLVQEIGDVVTGQSDRIRISDSSGLTWSNALDLIEIQHDTANNKTIVTIGSQIEERSGIWYVIGGEIFDTTTHTPQAQLSGDLILSTIEPDHGPYGYFYASSIEDARIIAAAVGGHLLEIDSDAENASVGQFMRAAGENYLRMGINDIENEGIWTNALGDVISYDDFGPYEPNDWGYGEDFADISIERFFSNGDDSIGWNDSRGDGNLYVVELDDLKSGADTNRTGDSNNIVNSVNDTPVILEGGNDTFYGNADDNIAGGSEGSDVLFGDLGDDLLSGGDGGDELHGGAGQDSLYGGNGDDVMYGDGDRDTLLGGDGNDIMYGGDDGDYLRGQDGNDTIYGGLGWDNVDPGRGSDYVDLGEDHGGSVRYRVSANEDNVWNGDLSTVALSSPNGAVTDQLTLVGKDNDGNNIAIISVDINQSAEVIVSQHPTGANTSNGDVDTIIGAYEIQIELEGEEASGQLVVRVNPWDVTLRGSLLRDGEVNVINGTPAADNLTDTNYDDSITAGDGNDYVEFWGDGQDTANLGDGDDVIWPEGWDYSGDSNSINVIDGGNGYDTIHIDTWGGLPEDGHFVIELVSATSGEYTKVYRVYDPTDENQDWQITLNGDGSGSGVYNNFGQREFLKFTNVERVEFNSANQTIEQGNTRFARFELFGSEWEDTTRVELENIGTDGDDTLVGDRGDNYLAGFDGNDFIDGGLGGNDTLVGGLGNDTLIGGTGENNETRDVFYGGDGDDFVVFGAGIDDENADRSEYISEAGDDTIDMNNVWGWIHYDRVDGNNGIVANITNNELVIDGIEMQANTVLDQFGDIDTFVDTSNGVHFWGTEFDDTFVTDKWFWWSAVGGDDTVQIQRSTPTGTLEADWNSAVDWTLGSSVYSYEMDGGTHTVTVAAGSLYGLKGGRLADTLSGDANDNELYGDIGNDTLFGGDGNDRLWGGTAWQDGFTYDGDDDLDGGFGNDELNGNAGNDYLFGNEGLDTIAGGAGRDTLRGGNGEDELSGGSGIDTFVDNVNAWHGDVIVDYEAGETIIFEADAAHDWTKFAVNNNQDGTYTITDFNILSDGTYSIGTMTIMSDDSGLLADFQVDAATNDATLVLTSDGVRIIPQPVVDTIAGDNILTQDELSTFAGITGTTEAGAKVTLSVVGALDSETTVTADNNGSFIFTSEDLELETDPPSDGIYRLAFTATDAAGNVSSPTYKTVEVDLVSDATIVSGDPEVIIEVSDAEIAEGVSASGEFRVRLGAEVRDGREVTITFSTLDTDLVSIDGSASLTFDASNWSQFQTITVSGVENFTSDGDVPATITGTIQTNDLAYYRVTVPNVIMVHSDNEEAGQNLYGTDDIDYLYGGGGDDRLYGRGNLDWLEGGLGNDSLYGQEDDDFLYGQDGDDKLYGGYGDDYLEGGDGDDILNGEIGADTMIGGAGNDTYYVDDAGDVIDDQGGEDDIDTVIITQTITFKLNDHVTDAALNSESKESSLVGNAGRNSLTGNEFANSLDGGDGDDVLYAGGGDDTVLGGEGDDKIIGGSGEGDDSYDGGVGVDTVSYTSATAGILVNLNLGAAESYSSQDANIGKDMLRDIENIIGGTHSDELVGNSVNNAITDFWGNDTVRGGSGDDFIFVAQGINDVDGGSGSDTLLGSSGDDTLTGGSGNDIIIGDRFARGSSGEDRIIAGAGTDILQGSGGSDVFVFNANEGTNTIGRLNDSYAVIGRDFDVTEDVIELNTGFNFSSAQAAADAFSNSGDYAVMTANGTTIRLFGVDADDLTADNFDIA